MNTNESETEINPEIIVMPSEPDFKGDPEAKWVYWVINDPAEIDTEWIWERLRNKRDALLEACDFRMITDAPWDTAPWIQYRQALRDLPKLTQDPRLVEWPVAPNE